MANFTVVGKVIMLVGIAVAMAEIIMMWHVFVMVVCLLVWIVRILYGVMKSLSMLVTEVMIMLIVLVVVIVVTTLQMKEGVVMILGGMIIMMLEISSM